MGTRGAIGFRYGSVDKITYNHFDSYPEGLGKTVLEAIRDVNPKDMLPKVFAIEVVDSDAEPTAAQIANCEKYTDLKVSRQSTSDWYCLLRDAQGELKPYLQGELQVMIDSHEFMTDSLFCEYAYIINLDENVLEFYLGYNKDPKAPGRYANCKPDDQGYRGVVLAKTWPLDTLHNALRKQPTAIARIIKQMDKLKLPTERKGA